MAVQRKLYPCFDKDFWKDLDRSISFMVHDLIVGRDVARLATDLRKAGVQKCTDSLLYKWSNPNAEQKPSLKQFLLLVKITENCQPIEQINGACGKICGPEDDYFELIQTVSAEYEKRKRMAA